MRARFAHVVVDVACDDARTERAVAARLAALPRSDDDPDVRVVIRRAPAPTTDGPSWRLVYEGPTGTVHCDDAQGVIVVASGGCAALARPAAGTCDVMSPDLDPGSVWVVSHPLLSVPVSECLRHRGLFPVHAAGLVAPSGRSMLVAGPSGSGKSTTTLLLAAAGWRVAADDTVFIQADRSVVGWADELDLLPAVADLLPSLAPPLLVPRPAGWPKHAVPLAALGEPYQLPFRPDAVVFVDVAADGRTVVEPVPSLEALRRLVPQVLATDPGTVRRHVRAIRDLVATTQAVRVRLGDPDSVVTALDALVSGARSGDAAERS